MNGELTTVPVAGYVQPAAEMLANSLDCDNFSLPSRSFLRAVPLRFGGAENLPIKIRLRAVN